MVTVLRFAALKRIQHVRIIAAGQHCFSCLECDHALTSFLLHFSQIYVSDQNGRFMSDKERLSLSVKHAKPRRRPMKAHYGVPQRPFNLKAVKDTLNEEELPGAVTVEKAASKSGLSSGVLAAIIVCSVSVFIFLVVLGLYRLKK